MRGGEEEEKKQNEWKESIKSIDIADLVNNRITNNPLSEIEREIKYANTWSPTLHIVPVSRFFLLIFWMIVRLSVEPTGCFSL